MSDKTKDAADLSPVAAHREPVLVRTRRMLDSLRALGVQVDGPGYSLDIHGWPRRLEALGLTQAAGRRRV